jgi:hypothetical protein
MTTLNCLTDPSVQYKKVAPWRTHPERIKVDGEFVLESLGGVHEVTKLGDQFGISLHSLLRKAETDWCRYDHGQRKELVIFYTNYLGGWDKKLNRIRPYPDITIKLLNYDLYLYDPVVSRSSCSDIGYRQSRDQAKEYVRNWFHTEVFSILLEYVFT